MPIDSKADNEQAIVGKVQIQEITMATSHGSTPPGTCHTDLSVENKCTHLVTGPTMSSPRGGGREQTKVKSGKARARPQGQNYTAMTQLDMSTAIIRWSTADLPVNSDY